MVYRWQTLLLLTVLLLSVNGACVWAGQKTFAEGSLIIPMDPCWQPNNDPQVDSNYLHADCSDTPNDQGIFQAYGLVYTLASQQVPVYWIIDSTKVDRHSIDFTILAAQHPPVLSYPAGTPIDPATRTVNGEQLAAHLVEYRGGPFVIDAKDLDQTARNILADYPAVRIHQATLSFVAPVEKTLSNLPPRIAVLGQGATDVLTDYLMASGLGHQTNLVYDILDIDQIVDGTLQADYQLFWAPHWLIEDEVPEATTRQEVMVALRTFLESGNSAFLECASLESVEGSSSGGTSPATANEGGWLTDRQHALPRQQTNLGSLPNDRANPDLSFLSYGQAANSLTQCAGWQFAPSGGHVHNFRPRPSSGLGYNGTVERFVHDRDGDYPPAPDKSHDPGFDYFIGGRINGSPTQGYVAYLAGHKYAECSDTGSTELELEIRLDRSVGAGGYLELTLTYAGGQTLVARFGMNGQLSTPTTTASLSRTRIDDGRIAMEFADATWQERRTLKGVVIRNLSSRSLPLENLEIGYPPQTASRLVELNDRNRVLDPDRERLCRDLPGTPASCPLNGSLPAATGTDEISSCTPVWKESNTCGIRYVLNTVLGLQYTLVPHEYVTTSPIVDDGVLYTASFEQPEHKGHLHAIDITAALPQRLWDAGDQVPLPGTGQDPGEQSASDPPTVIAPGNQVRTVFTNQDAAHRYLRQDFSAASAHDLRQELDVQALADAQALINTVRGRKGSSATLIEGNSDLPHRLWGISRSTPAVVGVSRQVSSAEQRDKVVYAGAEDGMLHAFYAGTVEPGGRRYSLDDPAAGRELWAYIPRTLLPHLMKQPFNEPNRAAVVHVDGSPGVGDFFLDRDGDGHPEWRTLLVGTASIQNRNQGIVFTLDVSDPYDPQVLWERSFTAQNLGNARGVAIGSVRSGNRLRNDIYLTTSFAEKLGLDDQPDALNGQYGVQVTALDLLSGEPAWHFASRYEESAANINATPAIPALMDTDNDGSVDQLVFGDMAGRLWMIDQNGEALGNGPIFTVPGGAAEPIGSGVAVDGRVLVFATGGTEHAADDRTYAIYAVEIGAGGSTLLWTYNLEPGEKVWGTPTIDKLGQVFFGTATGYRAQLDPGEQATSGRLVVLDKTGRELSSTVTSGAILGNVEVSPGVVVTVSLTGEVNQLGTARRTDLDEEHQPLPLKVYSWRAP